MTHTPTLRIWSLTAAAMLAASGAGQAAVLYWEVKHEGLPLAFLNEKFGSNDQSFKEEYQAKWTLDGFDPKKHSILGIKVSFSFADDKPGRDPAKETNNGNNGDVKEYVDIWLDGQKIWDDLEVDGEHPSSKYATYSQILNPQDHEDIFADLQEDGKLKYKVKLQDLLQDTGSESKKREDTYLKIAKIKVWGEEIPCKVPEGGTGLGLLALSLAGLVRLRRKLS